MAEKDAVSEPKKQKMRMTIAFQVEYDAPVDLYESEDPEKMAEQDTEAVMNMPFQALRAFVKYPGARFKAKVVPILTTGQKAGLEIKE